MTNNHTTTTTTTKKIYERQAAGLVREYLQVSKLTSTLNTFETEYQSRHRHKLAHLVPKSVHLYEGSVKDALLAYFDQGDRGLFFSIWDKHFIHKEDGLRLEFHASIYFAIYPALAQKSRNNTRNLSSTLDTFKVFLESRGARLSQTPEFLPYYALPFIHDPATHPTFSKLFSPEWINDLRSRLSTYMSLNVPSAIVELVGAYDTLVLSNTQLQKRYQHVQADYHNLLAIASELIGTLAHTLDGKQQISREYIASVVDRMQPFRKNVQYKQSIPYSPQFLDFDRIRQVLGDSESPVRTIVILLHALRQRAISQPTSHEVRSVVMTYVEYDVLGIHSTQPSEHLMTHPNVNVQDQMVQLVHLICYFKQGRQYLTGRVVSRQAQRFLKQIVTTLKSSIDKPLLQHQLLGILEKLSVQRWVQSYLITDANILDYVCKFILPQTHKLPDLIVVYVCALISTLFFRTSAKKLVAAQFNTLLPFVQKLLDHSNLHVRSYVYGMIFILIEVPIIMEQCRAVGVPDMIVYARELASGSKAPDHVLVQQMDRLLDKFSTIPLGFDEQSLSNDGSDCDEEIEEEYIPVGDVESTADLGAEFKNQLIGGEFLRSYAVSDTRSQGKTLSPTQMQTMLKLPVTDPPILSAMDKLRQQVFDTTLTTPRLQSKPTQQSLSASIPSTFEAFKATVIPAKASLSQTTNPTRPISAAILGSKGGGRPSSSRSTYTDRNTGSRSSTPYHLQSFSRPGTGNELAVSSIHIPKSLGSPLTRSRKVSKIPLANTEGQFLSET